LKEEEEVAEAEKEGREVVVEGQRKMRRVPVKKKRPRRAGTGCVMPPLDQCPTQPACVSACASPRRITHCCAAA
jgi:hypothetical protein